MLTAVLLLVLVAVLVVLVHRVDDHNARVDARDAATLVARQEAVNLTTLDYRHATRDLDRILALATGGLKSRFASQRATFPDVLGRDKSQSTGSVLSAGLVSLSGDRRAARVVVATDATVSIGGETGQSTLKHYRMVMHLRVVGGEWRVAGVAFAGAPQ